MGINLATVSWKAFQDRCRSAELTANAKYAAVKLSHNDSVNGCGGGKNKAQTIVVVACGWLVRSLIWVTKKFWLTLRPLAFLCAMVGVGMLYFDEFSRWDFLLLLPPAIYWLTSVFLLLVVTLVTKTVMKQLLPLAQKMDEALEGGTIPEPEIVVTEAPEGAQPQEPSDPKA